MANILMFKQPYPMGNHHLIPKIGKMVKSLGEYEVYIIEQFNSPLEWNNHAEELLKQLKEIKWDYIYFEMLDKLTFNLVSKLEGIKILCYASKGIFSTFEDILKYKEHYYDRVLTNSYKMYKFFVNHGVQTEYFSYYITNVGNIPLDEIETNNDVVFLGGGNQRLDKNNTQYKLEQDLIFFNPKVKKYGSGYYQGLENYQGIVGENKIGELYKLANLSLAMIEPTQRSMGMINNRYSEILASGGTLVSPRYKNEIEWGEMENYISFADTPEELGQLHGKTFLNRRESGMYFYKNKIEPEFLGKLNNLLK